MSNKTEQTWYLHVEGEVPGNFEEYYIPCASFEEALTAYSVTLARADGVWTRVSLVGRAAGSLVHLFGGKPGSQEALLDVPNCAKECA